MTLFVFTLVGVAGAAVAEQKFPLPGGSVAFSTRGATAFRVRVLKGSATAAVPFDTPMVEPAEPDASFSVYQGSLGSGIKADGIGSMILSAAFELVLIDASGSEVMRSAPLSSSNDTCAAQPGMDVAGGTRAASPRTVPDESACCAACKHVSSCKNWIYGHPGDEEGNCWLMSTISGTVPRSDRTLGGSGTGNDVRLGIKAGTLLYGGGGDKSATPAITHTSGSAYVDNTKVFAPYFYSTSGFACLAAVNTTTGDGKTNVLPVSYSTDGKFVTWTYPDGPIELYLMPGATLDAGTSAYLKLTGTPPVPPRYAFGFIASRWGWQNRSYIESVLHRFRDGRYPIDAFIGDFGWFTNVSDYKFPPQGFPWYHDFGFSPQTFPEPAPQLASYRKDLHFRMGGIRKPRLGNTDLLNEARAKGFLLPGGEMRAQRRGVGLYAEQRNINFSSPAAREWYVEKQKHYLADGVSFFWNDEGETDYYTFHWWNVAQAQTVQAVRPGARFYSINRAWTPGMARLGATVWTGDINPSWDDLASTPAMILNWGLAGAPYVACDIGGFTGATTAPLLLRWMQLGSFMPTMRVHSVNWATPHFPWLFPEPYDSLMRAALELRYRLLPYHYSLAHTMHSAARLWMRPLAAAYPTDETAATLASQWLDGALLVAPVLTEDSTRHVYLPTGTWYHFNSSRVESGPTWLNGTAAIGEVPCFVPPGAVVPLGPVVQHSDALPGGPLSVHVYGGADGSFALVEDDGETDDYARHGKVRTTQFTWDEKSRTLSWSVSGTASSPQMFVSVGLTLFTSDGGRFDSGAKQLGTGGSIVALGEAM